MGSNKSGLPNKLAWAVSELRSYYGGLGKDNITSVVVTSVDEDAPGAWASLLLTMVTPSTAEQM